MHRVFARDGGKFQQGAGGRGCMQALVAGREDWMTLEETRRLCDFVKSRADEALAALEHIYRAVDLHNQEIAEAEDQRQTVLPFVRRAA